MRGLTLITTGLSLLGPAAAILVADNSPCGTVCGNVLDATTIDDVVCHEGDYTSGSGIVFQQCLTCEQNSDYSTKNNETDQQYFLCKSSLTVCVQALVLTFSRQPPLRYLILFIRNPR